MEPKVSLAMIVRNEAADLPDCIAGVAGLVDEIVVVDTGSTDGTKRVAASLGAVVADFPWTDDFAAARNASRRLATGDWIFSLDADDRVDEENRARLADLLRQLKRDPSARNSIYMMACVSEQSLGKADWISQSRLFPNRPDLTWKGRIHERLELESGERLNSVATEVVIRHQGSRNPAQHASKRHRNLRILEQDFLAHPDDSLTLFHLGRARHWQGRYADAQRLLHRSILQDPAGFGPTTPQAYALIADTLYKASQFKEAMRVAEEGLARFHDFVPLLYLQGWMLESANRLAEAEQIFRRVINVSPKLWAASGIWPDLQGEKSRLMLGHICRKQGRYADAEAEYCLALASHPHSTAAWFLLGQVKLSLNRPQEAFAIAARLEGCPGATFEWSLLRGQICVVTERFDEAKYWVERAISARPDDVAGYVVLSSLLSREGKDLRRCIEVHAKVLAMDPGQAEVSRRLEQLRTRAVANDVLTMPGIHPAVTQFSDQQPGGLSFSC